MAKILSGALLALSLSLSLASIADAAPQCTTGKPCGDACIPKDKTCHIPKKAAKECKKGKLCGDTCIAKEKECTK